MNTCANCGAPIGKLETPFDWKGQTVCAACYQRLRQAAPDEVIPYATPARREGRVSGWWFIGGIAFLLLLGLGFAGLFTVGTAVSIPATPSAPPPAMAPVAATTQDIATIGQNGGVDQRETSSATQPGR